MLEQAIRTSETVPELFAPTAVDELLRYKQTEMQQRKFAATLVEMLAQYEMIRVEGEEVRQRTKYLLNQSDTPKAEQNLKSSSTPANNCQQPILRYIGPTTKKCCWPELDNTV